MARFIEGGATTFDALVYSRPHPNTMQFLEQQFHGMTDRLTQAGQQFMQGAAEMYERISSSRAMEAMRQAARSVRSLWQMDEISFLQTIEQFQFAPLSMQRYIMAEPMARQLYVDQSLEGYVDTYVDMHPGDVGERHYDFRRATDGLVIENESDDPDEAEWVSTTYFDELLEGDQDLLLSEQVDIQYSWQWLRHHLKAKGEDPTSRYGTKML